MPLKGVLSMASSTINNYVYNMALEDIFLRGGYSGVNFYRQKGCKHGVIKAIQLQCTLRLDIPASTKMFEMPDYASVGNYSIISAIDVNTNKIYWFRVDIEGSVYTTTESIPSTADLRFIDVFV